MHMQTEIDLDLGLALFLLLEPIHINVIWDNIVIVMDFMRCHINLAQLHLVSR